MLAGMSIFVAMKTERGLIDLRLVFRDGKEIGTDDLNLYYN